MLTAINSGLLRQSVRTSVSLDQGLGSEGAAHETRPANCNRDNPHRSPSLPKFILISSINDAVVSHDATHH